MSTSDSGPTGPESSSPNPPRTCPHCGAVLPADAPEGQCPACLLLNLTLEPTAVPPTQPAEPPKPPSPPLTPAALAPHFPHLEILECLGRGGMGVVYKARQKSLNRLVALKLLAPEREKDAAFAERFTREAQALALLSHSHIVTVYDFGVTSPSAEGAGDGFYYLLMEYVDGVNLRQLLDQRKLTPEEALAIVPPLCDALEYAHERGIVHRDIKPENLLLERRGQVKIADFGIAKMLGNGTPSHTTGGIPVEPAPAPLGVTQPETALGTPAYMAPEQASAPERVDSRADIYSLGVVFYEMLTGELPAKQIEAASSRLKNLHIDVRVDEIVLRALEKKPEMRWQTAAELRTRVEQVSSATSAPPVPLPTDVSDSAPKLRPFYPWMQRFVARSFETRRALFWGLLFAGTLLTALFMMPVSKHRVDPTPWFQMDPNSRMVSKDDWLVRGEFGLPDAWWIETVRQSTVPVTNANGKVVGRTISQASQVEREVHFFTLSYAMGAVAGLLWILFWCFFAAEQRAGDALPPAQRAFAMTMVNRTSGTRILWGHILLQFLAFVGTSVVLSGHMTACMMLLLGDGPHPILNAFFTTFILSFVFAKGLGGEIAVESATAGSKATPAVGAAALHARSCGPVAAAVGFVTAFVVPFLIYWLNEAMTGHVKDRFLISVFLVTWGVSMVVAHWVLSRRKLSEAVTRIWLRTTSVCGWLVSLPVVGMAAFFAVAASNSSSWNPAPAEAFMVPAFWLGALLLPVASWYLWRASSPSQAVDERPRRSPWRVVLGVFLLLAALAVPLVHLASHAMVRARDQANFARQRNLLQQRAIFEQANLDHLQDTVRDLQAQQQSTQSSSERAKLQEELAAAHQAVASAQGNVDASMGELQTLVGPPPGPVLSVGLGYSLLGSAVCVGAALLLFRRSRSPTDGYPRFILPVLLVVTLGHVMFAVVRFYMSASPHAGEFGRVEIPFAYNYTVRGNVLLVTLTAKVGSRDLELNSLLRGAEMSRDERQLADRAYSEPKAFPGHAPARQPKILHPGANMVELAFAFPDGATARHAGGNLRSVGILSPAPGRAVSGVLFQVNSQEHGVYQGEIQFSVPGIVEEVSPVVPPTYDGVLFRGTSVEHLPGTRHVKIHFARSDHSGSGLESFQDINLSPEGKGPASVGSPGWKTPQWVGPEGPHMLAWTLPAEFSNEDMEDLVHRLRKDWLQERMLPHGGVPVFARLKHRDGWVCTLLARVKHSPGTGGPSATPIPGAEPPNSTSGQSPFAPSTGPAPRAQSADPPIMDTSDAALRSLSWQTFDQTPGQYWRQLADVRRYREAAELIERYLALHPELEEGAQQINGANLHFHAAQCHAFARNKDQALTHLQRALHPLPTSNKDSRRWNCYVSGTDSFLLGDHERMISAYVSLATQTTFSDPNLITLDRLLAGFGKTYAEAYEANESDDHKKLSADFFNRAWELLDRKVRSPEEDAQMRSYAHASLAHWRQREDCKPRNLSIAYWQLSRIYAVQQEWVSAQVFAHLCLSVSEQEPPYYLGYAHEAMARAVVQKGDFPLFQKHLALAREQASRVTDADERKMLEKDLNELEASVPAELRPAPSSQGGTPTPGTASPPVE